MPSLCKDCGETVPDEPGLAQERTPCPKCGSRARDVAMHTKPGEYKLKGSNATLTVRYYSEIMLDNARALLSQGHTSVAIITAHTACEVAVQRAIQAKLTPLAPPEIRKIVLRSVRSFNLKAHATKELYHIVTGESIQTDPAWEAFTASVERRNHCVHEGYAATQKEAEDSLAAVNAIVARVIKHL